MNHPQRNTLAELDGYRLSPQQTYFWTLQEASVQPFVSCSIRLDGPLDTRLLAEVVRSLVARHEALRTRFPLLPGMRLPVQVIESVMPVVLREARPVAAASCEHSQTSSGLATELATAPLDLAQGPGVHFVLRQLQPDRHMLDVVISALCADLTSLAIMCEELAQLYAQGVSDEVAELSEPRPYLDYSEWCNEVASESVWKEGLQLWARVPPPTAFETMARVGPRSKLGSNRESSFVLERGQRDALAQSAAEHGVSLESTILAAWAVVLGRVRDEPDVVVDTLLDGRRFPELEKMVGAASLFAPLELCASGGLTAHALLVGVHERVERGRQHLEACVEACTTPEVARATYPGFAFVPVAAPPRAGPMHLHYQLGPRELGPHGLALWCVARADALHLTLSFDDALYSAQAIAALGGQLRGVLGWLTRGGDLPVRRWHASSADARRRVASEWNATTRDWDCARTAIDAFEEQVARTPQLTAVEAGTELLAYDALNRYANRVAYRLRELGVGTESRVALLLERRCEAIVGLLGIWKAGAAYVPLDPSEPRLCSLLADSGCAAAIIDSTFADRIAPTAVPYLSVDETLPASALAESNPARDIRADNLAYVIYTSGSTGRPKGVMVSHRSLLNLVGGLGEALGSTNDPRQRVSVNAPLFFDSSIKQIVQLLSGHTLVLVPERVRRDPLQFRDFLARAALDVLDLTPTQLGMLLEALGESSLRELPPNVLLGGERIDPQRWARLAAENRTRFINLYGLTECSVDSALTTISPADPAGTVGRPLANVRLYVLDADGELVDQGVPGEVYVGGEGLARGYLDQPALTAARFVPDPFSGTPGARLYRTGDRGAVTAEGKLVLLGRVDQQVKLRGHRVELGEIEHALARHASVREACVVCETSAQGDGTLVAYVVPRDRDAGAHLTLPNGLVVAQQNRNETEYLYEEIFAHRGYLRHGVRLYADMCVLDVGANIGMFALFVAKHARNPKIYCFEPLPPIFRTLGVNARLFPEQIRPIALGLSSQPGVLSLTYYPRYSMMSGRSDYADSESDAGVIKRYLQNAGALGVEGSTLLLDHADELLRGRFEGQSHACQVKTLSTVMRELGLKHVDLLKIDVQRAELDVLLGIEHEDWERIAQIVMELHAAPGTESEGRTIQLQAMLEARGYTVTIEQDPVLRGTDRYNLYALRPSAVRPAEMVDNPPVAAGALNAEELRNFLRGELPDYMIPGSFVSLSSLPLTPSGKLDRRALTSADAQRLSLAYTPPRNATEIALAEVWCAILGKERVGIHDNFFDIGGDSILSIRAQALAEERGLHFTLQDLFEHQTIALLASSSVQLRAHARSHSASHPFDLLYDDERSALPGGLEDAYPVTSLQAGMIFHSEYRADPATYHNVSSASLRGELSLPALRHAIQSLLRAHPVLRTSFQLGGSARALQLVHVDVALPLEVYDLQALEPAAQEREIEAWMERERTRSFAWHEPPLLRFAVHLRAERQFQFSWAEYHGILDGWSLHCMLTELFGRYGAELEQRGAAAEFAPPPLQFRDSVRAELEAVASAEVKEFWRNELAGALPCRLPRRARKETTARAARVQRVRFAAEPLEALTALARQAGVPLKTALLTAHLQVIRMATASEDCITGLVVNTRIEAPGGDRVLGLFLNTIPFRMPAGTRGDWIDRIKAVFRRERALLPFRRLPLAEIQKQAAVAPLFDAFFNFSQFRSEGTEGRFGPLEVLETKTIVVDIDYALSADFELNAEGDELLLSLFYDTAELNEEQVCSLARLYERTLAEMAGFSGAITGVVARPPAIGAAPGTQEPAPFELLHAAVHAQALRTPRAPAIWSRHGEWSYAELDARVKQLSRRLRAAGCGPGRRVGVLLHRQPKMIAALLGVLRSGAAYVPLDPTHPRARLEWLTRDARLELIISEASLAELVPRTSGRVLWLDDSAESIESATTLEPRRDARPSDIAYVIFTSGTTGEPKGVEIAHQSACSLVAWAGRFYAARELTGVLASTALSFDLSVFELFAPLVWGGRVVLVEDLFELARLPPAADVRLVNTVPTLLKAYLREHALPSSVVSVNLAGESLSPVFARRVHVEAGVDRVVNLYGPTEGTTYASAATVAADAETPPSIGYAIAGAQLYVLDEQMQPVELGVAGELFLGGAGLARGYLGQPGLTAACFVPDPLSGNPGARLYRTGDRACQRLDGSFEFLGRSDSQLKIRGARIELAEIEASLDLHPDVSANALSVRCDREDGPWLAAFVLPHAGSELERLPPALRSQKLRAFLRTRLPEYMVPRTFACVTALPHTASGKLDRAALAAIDAQPIPATEPRLPRTQQESELVSLWSELLLDKSIRVDADFFDLGGDSLAALRLIARLRARTGRELSLRALVEHPTVARLAAHLETVGAMARPEQGDPNVRR